MKAPTLLKLSQTSNLELVIVIKIKIDIFIFLLYVIPIPTPEFQSACSVLDRASNHAREMLDYFTMLLAISNYINDGMEDNNPNSFSGYIRYLDALKHYNENNTKALYEEITDDRDYDRYERNAAERLTILNPVVNGTFRRTNKHLYKYKAIQNYDEAVLRRRSLKKKIYDKYGVGKLARRANRSKDISV